MAILTYPHSSKPSAAPATPLTAPSPPHPAPTTTDHYSPTLASCSPTPAISAGPANDELPIEDMSTTNPTYPSAGQRRHTPQLKHYYDTKPLNGAAYQVKSPIFEEYDIVAGYVESAFGDEIRKSIESEGQEQLWMDGVDLFVDEGLRWCGYVQYAESSERSSLRTEAKRDRKARERKRTGVRVRVEREKRVRGK
ncbi:hypothetical protein K458DRAFT_423038 [Lentithecium fluviatile CBS 122367]|uniref:Uncharacterized protein n=1 Tax=Lentithecium fluviatile CBS 122367 TaxID=1168545 RepID=A0A6G1IK30_9PLEO|nr:hypothetical protein K458DRAFT_423038 [Lentithecium fluviatile CBS 122367]